MSEKKEPGFKFYFLAALVFVPTAIALWRIVAGADLGTAAKDGAIWAAALFATMFAGGAVIGIFDNSDSKKKEDDSE